ncbi:MAG: low-specificity L-threonine aldolase [Chloroflexi bacterium]|nr:low-specificity L-threonine aldolase [Chloroflexota bacterium]
MIDLRSDTVTKPTEEMRRAMAEAEVGDDVYGEDPTVNALEALGAELTGQEAGLFVASGSMANLCALLAHTERGDEFIVGESSHIFVNEVASFAVVGGLQPRPLFDGNGGLDPNQVEDAVRGEDIHWPRTRVICLENTHNSAGGLVIPPEDSQAILDIARRHGLKTHLDGARLFNAAVYLGVAARQLAQGFDSVYICLSKGLGAPVGSLLTGRRDFVEKARKYRKMLGGGWRQAGVLAAAGLLALTDMPAKLAEDHANSRRLAEGLARLPGVELDLARVQTNIIFVTVRGLSTFEVASRLGERGVLVSPGSERRMRLVTHHQVSAQDVDRVLDAFGAVLERVSV